MGEHEAIWRDGAPAPMIEIERVFLGTPASFESTVLLYDARLLMRQAPRLNASRYAFYVASSAIKPIRQNAPYVVGKGRAAPQLLANPGQWCKIEIAPPSYTTSPDAGITAQLMPGERSLVVLWCEPGAWPDIEPHWRDLLAELARLGLLEKAEAEPPASPTQEMIDTVRGWPVAKAAGQIKAHYYRDKGVTQSTFYRWQREVRKWEEAQQCHDTAEIA